jgi:hypothetical protein
MVTRDVGAHRCSELFCWLYLFDSPFEFSAVYFLAATGISRLKRGDATCTAQSWSRTDDAEPLKKSSSIRKRHLNNRPTIKIALIPWSFVLPFLLSASSRSI